MDNNSAKFAKFKEIMMCHPFKIIPIDNIAVFRTQSYI